MSEKRKVKDIHGKDLRDFPPTELITRPKTGPGGITVAEEIRIPGREMPVIEGVKPKPVQIQAEYKPSVTVGRTTNHVAVSDPRHVLAHATGNPNPKKEILGGRLAEHLVPSRTRSTTRNVTPGEQKDMKRVMAFIEGLQPKEEDE